MGTLLKSFGFSGKLSLLAAGTLLWVGISGQPSLAQEISDSHLDAAKKAMVTTNGSAKFNDILPTAAARLAAQMISRRPDIEEQITTVVNEVALSLAPRRADLQTEAAKIYARIFSEQELKDISVFFATEAGQKFLRELPLVVRQVQQASRIWGNGISRDLNTEVRKKMQETATE